MIRADARLFVVFVARLRAPSPYRVSRNPGCSGVPKTSNALPLRSPRLQHPQLAVYLFAPLIDTDVPERASGLRESQGEIALLHRDR